MTFVTKIWSRIVPVLRLWILLAFSTLATLPMLGFDGHYRANIAYDGSRVSEMDYDTGLILSTGERKIETIEGSALFSNFVVFLAAEETAMRNVVEFQGMEVRAVRDLSHLDQGTLEGMQEVGFAPRTVNGEQISLHHLNQNPAGPLVEMPRGNNLVGNTVQHPFGNTAGAGLTDAQRATYNAWRTDYWKWRATQELNLRRVLGN